MARLFPRGGSVHPATDLPPPLASPASSSPFSRTSTLTGPAWPLLTPRNAAPRRPSDRGGPATGTPWRPQGSRGDHGEASAAGRLGRILHGTNSVPLTFVLLNASMVGDKMLINEAFINNFFLRNYSGRSANVVALSQGNLVSITLSGRKKVSLTFLGRQLRLKVKPTKADEQKKSIQIYLLSIFPNTGALARTGRPEKQSNVIR